MPIPIMRIFAQIALIVITTLPILAQANQSCDIEITKKLYLQLDKKDREARDDFMRSREKLSELAKARGTAITDQEMAGIFKTMGDLDTQNQLLLDQIVSQCGWPTYEKWGATPVYAAVTVALHAPLDFKKKYFPDVEAGFKRGDVPADQYAQYVDKILIRENKPQRYGMQRERFKDGSEQVLLVEDPAHLNDRRQAIGLKPLGDFPMPSNWPGSQPQSTPTGTAAPQAANKK